jgi:squalene-hopene/tetraprenyl-beta-curcumene cyclase
MPKTSLVFALVLAAAAVLACSSSSGGGASSNGTSGGGGTSSGGEAPVDTTLEGLAPDWRQRAAGHLEARAKAWLTSRPKVANIDCAMSCHTTFPYLLARATLAKAAQTPSADAARVRFTQRVSEATQGNATPFYGQAGSAKEKESHGTEAVLNAAALALDDLGSGQPLRAETKSALDRMWAMQRADGAWDWLEFQLEPWETRSDWGAALAALVAGSVPEGTSAAQAAGSAKLVGYLRSRLAAKSGGLVLHDRAMVLWASGSLKGLLAPADADAIATALASTQLEDGGFSLGAWGQGGHAAATAKTSDGYATALAVLALCKGTPEGKARGDVKRGLSWLAKHQAEDGSWPGRSVNSSSQRAAGFMTDAATAYASIAIATCAP